MFTLLLASHNQDKAKELKALLSGMNIQLLTLNDFPNIVPTIEDQDTISANAMKKAFEASLKTGLVSLADDTGLFIKALNDKPGVYSARFAGEHCSYKDNRMKVLKLMEGITNRYAEFRTCVALSAPDGIISFKIGILEGNITTEERGTNGFGYDSIFMPLSFNKTYAEMTDTEKNSISHRAKAIEAIIPIIKELIESSKGGLQ
ncbi:RdgB/HAM1 family non-canonical purine NTP pyrophosphatase [Candidatus Syntrophosphaera thermopropionivorans]|jgi:XTP/dITP diphosphohydrolase|uniref:RdgB/HAM1 family non-canonical purine NTP pyrophosphatase n=1 Tax=Candidatus Syntrophosphaera thermopropionivorans TaxID=2593015 RepID=A0AC61QI31_9BACT|nr:RdgB/HAM1 family non-canonical purine NTP pyrophosphatase [Candidatus Syntrophosphaera thermopropionivorans]TDF72614.1 RdgB/HAM1 family non-canonical purine NTP pyrophosphatase [Candidatus Syntrophosphaera thermopropionivorans]HOZ92301.1 RdgB/HAM1 family non-canonical purine NTP pyrophosphatase [Candidatus Syntrophosphaera thermopropionivorans]HQP84560.1 RdgB/HAM1 family non-canonical purine NTP pyrophosphatase [Candidatus Syntrophosphaera thermopropionivorans]